MGELKSEAQIARTAGEAGILAAGQGGVNLLRGGQRRDELPDVTVNIDRRSPGKACAHPAVSAASGAQQGVQLIVSEQTDWIPRCHLLAQVMAARLVLMTITS
jgi:hypothetical protein